MALNFEKYGQPQTLPKLTLAQMILNNTLPSLAWARKIKEYTNSPKNPTLNLALGRAIANHVFGRLRPPETLGVTKEDLEHLKRVAIWASSFVVYLDELIEHLDDDSIIEQLSNGDYSIIEGIIKDMPGSNSNDYYLKLVVDNMLWELKRKGGQLEQEYDVKKYLARVASSNGLQLLLSMVFTEYAQLKNTEFNLSTELEMQELAATADRFARIMLDLRKFKEDVTAGILEEVERNNYSTLRIESNLALEHFANTSSQNPQQPNMSIEELKGWLTQLFANEYSELKQRVQQVEDSKPELTGFVHFVRAYITALLQLSGYTEEYLESILGQQES